MHPAENRGITQLPVAVWHDVIDEPKFSEALLDRQIQNVYRLELGDHSMRRATYDPTEKFNEGRPAEHQNPCLHGNDPQVSGYFGIRNPLDPYANRDNSWQL